MRTVLSIGIRHHDLRNKAGCRSNCCPNGSRVEGCFRSALQCARNAWELKRLMLSVPDVLATYIKNANTSILDPLFPLFEITLPCHNFRFLRTEEMCIQFLLGRLHRQFTNLGYRIMAILCAPRGVNVFAHVLLLLFRGPHLHQSCKCIQASTHFHPFTTPRSGPVSKTFRTLLAIFAHALRGCDSTPHPDG